MSVKALSIVGATRTSVERYPRELTLAFLEVEQDSWAVADASCLDVDPQSLNSVEQMGFLVLLSSRWPYTLTTKLNRSSSSSLGGMNLCSAVCEVRWGGDRSRV